MSPESGCVTKLHPPNRKYEQKLHARVSSQMRLITVVISHSMLRLFGFGFFRLFGIGRRCINAAKVKLESPVNHASDRVSRHLHEIPIHALSQNGRECTEASIYK